jgi:type 1 fimbria pilin
VNRLVRAAGVTATGLVTVLLAVSAQATPKASISVSPSSVSPGGTVHISGSVSNQGCSKSEPVTLTSDSALFPPDGFGPDVDRDTNGSFATDYTVPTSTPPGAYRIGMRCGGGNVGVTATLKVIAPTGGPATGAGGTARGSAVTWTLLGLGCLALAGALVVTRRRLARRPS